MTTKSDTDKLNLKINGLYCLYAVQMAWLGWMTNILLEILRK